MILTEFIALKIESKLKRVFRIIHAWIHIWCEIEIFSLSLSLLRFSSQYLFLNNVMILWDKKKEQCNENVFRDVNCCCRDFIFLSISFHFLLEFTWNRIFIFEGSKEFFDHFGELLSVFKISFGDIKGIYLWRNVGLLKKRVKYCNKNCWILTVCILQVLFSKILK